MKRTVLAVLVALGCWASDAKMSKVIEMQTARVTISTKKEGKFEPGAAKVVAMVYVKVENLSEEPLRFDLTEAYLRDSTGKSLRRLEPAEAVVRFFSSSPVMRVFLQESRRDNPVMLQYEGQQMSLLPPVPAKSWKEGLIVFEGTGKSGKQPTPVELFVPGLLPAPVPLNW